MLDFFHIVELKLFVILVCQNNNINSKVTSLGTTEIERIPLKDWMHT